MTCGLGWLNWDRILSQLKIVSGVLETNVRRPISAVRGRQLSLRTQASGMSLQLLQSYGYRGVKFRVVSRKRRRIEVV